MTAPAPGYSKPTHPKLAKLFDKHIRDGDQIRYADDTQLVVWKESKWGAGGCLILIILGILTVFIVPIILMVLGALNPGGQVITYTVKPSGKIKKSMKAAARN